MKLITVTRAIGNRKVLINPDHVVWVEPDEKSLSVIIFMEAGEPLYVSETLTEVKARLED